MLRDITLGQYFPGDSVIHRMDPRLKIIWTLFYIVLLFFVGNAPGFAVYIVFTAVIIAMSKIKLSLILRGLRPILIFLSITAVLNLFMTAGTPLFTIGPFTATREGLIFAFYMVLRVALLIMGTSLLTFTTSPIMLTDAIERLLSPFSKIGVPAHAIAMMMTIAIRSIPIILEETDKIMKAQTARGANFKDGSLLKRAKSMIPLLVPLFISAFRRADELAVAMECRCYHGGEGRTRLRQLRFTSVDALSLCVVPLLLAAVILTKSLDILKI